MKIKFYQVCLLLCALSLFPFSTQANQELQFSDAWSPEAPPVAKVMAGYFTVINPGKEEVLITGITSPQFKSIEMHRIVHEDGMAKMRWQPHVHVKPGQIVQLKPGGKHLMLFKPIRWLKAGEKITLHITLSNKTQQTIQAVIRKN